MKQLFLLFVLPLITALPGLSADVSGKWAGSPAFLVLKQEGSSLTGTAGPSQHEQMPIQGGRIDGDRVTFSLGPYHFDLQLSGGQLRGEMTGERQPIAVLLKREDSRHGGGTSRFEVVSAKRSSTASGQGFSIKADPGRFTCSNITLRELILKAYDLKEYQLVAPEWMSTERYDITATMAAGSDLNQVQQMIQRMLSDRFRLAAHHKMREISVYALVTDPGGTKLKEVMWGRGSTSGRTGRMEAHSIRMVNLAEILAREVNRPVLDFTGLAGFYDFTLQWTPDVTRGQRASEDVVPLLSKPNDASEADGPDLRGR